MAEISRDEIDRLYKTLDDGFSGVHSRLDRLNGAIGEHTAELAVLKDRAHPAAWGGAIGGFVVSVVETIRWLLGR